MPCYSPLAAFRSVDGSVHFHEKGAGGDASPFSLPCGRCVGCRLERSRQWAVRCMHEASLFDQNAFITLTYADEHLPDFGSLVYRHFQLFMKRLRKVRKGVRFFMCGEYGESLGRPHYHALLFNCGFPDREVFSRSSAGVLYTSAELSRLWPYGHSSIAEVSFETAAYVARYSLKKVTGALADLHYSVVDPLTGEVGSKVPEFAHMSLKPGIGGRWFDKYAEEVWVTDSVVIRGKESKPPRYYDKLFKRTISHVDFQDMLDKREFGSYPSRADNTASRLSVKRQVAEAGLLLSRRHKEIK